MVLETGDKLNGETFGLLKDRYGNPIIDDEENFVCRNSVYGSGPDHTTILQKDGKTFMLTQFECGIGAMYLAELGQKVKGQWIAKSLTFIDQSPEFGGWVHCAGVRSPWGSHLGSEEYEPDAKLPFEKNRNGPFALKYWENDGAAVSSYYYGWIPEVKLTVDPQGYKYTKHYAMGRFSHELAYVMPDNRTVYLSDDGTNVGFYMFSNVANGDYKVIPKITIPWGGPPFNKIPEKV